MREREAEEEGTGLDGTNMRSTEEEGAAAVVVAATVAEEKGSAKGGIGIERTTRELGVAAAVSGESGAGDGGDPPHAAEEVAVAVVSCSCDVAGRNPWIPGVMGFGFQCDAFCLIAKCERKKTLG